MSNYQLVRAVNEQDHFQGNKEAPIVLLEYGDYECPYCGQAYLIVKQLQEDFGNDLGFVFRNFPLSQMHPHAFHAAEAAELAAEEGKFWEMHDSLYEDQENLGDLALAQRAKNLGMDPQQFINNLENNAMQQKVKEDFMSGVESGVGGTPTFFINGEKFEGSWDYMTMRNHLKSLL